MASVNSVLRTKLYFPVRVSESTTVALTFLDSGRTGAFISLLMVRGDANMLPQVIDSRYDD